MRLRIWILLIPALAIAAAQATAGEKKKEEPIPPRKIVSMDPRFDKLVAKDAVVETIARGFIWTEGVAWSKESSHLVYPRRVLFPRLFPGRAELVTEPGFLVFSDIPNNVVHKWQDGRLSEFVKPSGYTGAEPRGGKPGDEPGSNGLLFDSRGRLTLCEHGDRRVSRIEKNGAKTILADNYQGKKLNSPNDLVYHSNGDLYFTDPPYGRPKWEKDESLELGYFGVFLRRRGGELVLLTKEMTRPNGIALSPDQKTLYVANSDPAAPIWKSFPVKDDGTIGEGKLFVDGMKWVQAKRPGLPDGMKIDVHGNIWATGPGGVWVFAPDGTILGNIDTGTNTANVCFGDDGCTLYIAANHDICRVRTMTKGKGF
jgi:gluconolactonase